MPHSTRTRDILPDLLDFELVLVFCGTAASKISARAGAYYANPSNAFWHALWRTGITPRRLVPADFRALLDLKIGLTDVAKSVADVDSRLRRADFQPDTLRQKIAHFQPQVLAFTSKTAWRAFNHLPAATPVAYGWQRACQGETHFYVLPSPSGAARRYWDMTPWRTLADDYACRMLSL